MPAWYRVVSDPAVLRRAAITAIGELALERRGIVDVKGKGPIETWFLRGRRAAAAG